MADVYLRNDNSHGVRADGVRIPPGAVGRVDSDSSLVGANGVEKVQKSDYDDYQDSRPRRGDDTGVATTSEKLLREARLAGRLAVSAPLQKVVGDDQAPLGPPTGTVTTKQTAAGESDEARKAFAPNEAAPGSEVEVGEGGFSGRLPSQEVHNRQAAATEQVEEVTQALIDEERSGETVGDESPSE